MGPREQVELAIANYSSLPPAPLDDTITPETFYLATPNRLAYALAWVVANAIVQKRFLRTGIDVLPVFHPENGWDRFLITRRVTGKDFAYQPANEFGMLMLSGEDAPLLTTPGGKTRLALGAALQQDAEAAIAEVLKLIPSRSIKDEGKHLRTYEQAPKYPAIHQAVVDLIVENPGLVAAREIYIDAEEIDGQYHPLYLHAAELTAMGPDDRSGVNVATTTYRWFQLQLGDMFVFFDKRGNRTVYRTDRQTWARVKKQLRDGPDEDIYERIAGWLRIGDRQPNPEVD